MKENLQALLAQLNHGLIGRQQAIRTTLLTMLAGENIVLVGPPGTGKSLIARKIAQSLGSAEPGSGYFEYLLTKFSTPEEIFGPLSIADLKENRLKRNTAGYLPSVRVAFLDEVFKASSSILNALLTILNERVFHNGAIAEQVPLQGLIAASNELPIEQEELNALYDRFLVRCFVDYISDDQLSELLTTSLSASSVSMIDAQLLSQIQQLAEQVVFPPQVQQALLNIWAAHRDAFKEDRSERLSDRRFTKVAKLLRIAAVTNNRQQVDLSDLMLLKDCLWNRHENASQVNDLILKELRPFSYSVSHQSDKQQAATTAVGVAELHAKVKGLRGTGTIADPLLIADYNDLGILHNPAVGRAGYYFRQTADIDLSGHSHWTDIAFKGHYDGNGFSIRYKKEDNLWRELFGIVEHDSTIVDLVLVDLRLANQLLKSHVERCQSNIAPLLCSATSSVIENCCIHITQEWFDCADGWAGHTYFSPNSYERVVAGVCLELKEQTQVSNCYVAGQVRTKSNCSFVGIAADSDNSTIRRCAIGAIEYTKLKNRICSSPSSDFLSPLQSTPDSDSAPQNNALNISIDSNSGTDDGNGQDGKTVAAMQFNQSYLEYTLEWDFDTVWQWHEETNQPVLRPPTNALRETIDGSNQVDLLSLQVRQNIWL
ncbi:AAA family ATPase [Neiella sp. HB171785]|uniref:AAA family ATPase n=1 Tax=Neiella litorisoli TaxID=2771431 RepID=A0A8J6UDM2_9GAMM|nr:AAA family ATPase [Neiella litorisoli]MBD1388139.1 AAA family ATPase [Neiella litorisoli]